MRLNKKKFPIIIDDLISIDYMGCIEDSFINSSWYYSHNISLSDDYYDSQNGFSDSLDENHPQYALILYLIFKTCDEIKFKIDKILRIRKRLTYPNKIKYNIAYQPHIDYEEKNLVLLYYVNDSDGDTYIYNEKYKKKYLKNPIKNFSLYKKIEYKKGRIVIFDGKTFHSSSLSSNNPRMILNINLKGKFFD